MLQSIFRWQPAAAAGRRSIGGSMRLVRWLAAVLIAGSSSVLAQGNYPDRPIKMIVPLAAASAVDVSVVR